MAIIETPKLGVFRNILYYFKQNYIDWKYYANNTLWNSVDVEDYTYYQTDFRPATTYSSQSFVSSSVDCMFNEENFAQNKVNAILTISSEFVIPSTLLRYVTYNQFGTVEQDVTTSSTLVSGSPIVIEAIFPIGVLSKLDDVYRIEFYFSNRNVASIIYDSVTFNKNYNFSGTISINDYSYLSEKAAITSIFQLSASNKLFRSSVYAETANITNYSYYDSYLSKTSMITDKYITYRVPVSSETANIIDYSFYNYSITRASFLVSYGTL